MAITTLFPASSSSVSLGTPVFNITIHKRKDIIAQFGEIVDKEIQKALFKLVQQTRDKARRACPIDTGALKASIYATRYGTEKQQDMGYFRAIQASVRRRTKAINLGMAKSDSLLTLRTEGLTSFRRQLPLHYGKSRMSKIALRRQSFRPMVGADLSAEQRYGAYYVYVGAAAYYAGWVEFGHMFHGNYVHPQPFFGPACEWMEQQVPRVIMEAMQNANRNNLG